MVGPLKYHLKRVQEQTLTFEEFYTLLTHKEAVLNFRPIFPLLDDLNDLEALAPGHFLIGEPLTSLPTDRVKQQNLANHSR